MTCETYLSLWATLWTIAGALVFGLLLLTGAVYYIILLFRWMDEEVNPPTHPPRRYAHQADKSTPATYEYGTYKLSGGVVEKEQDDD